MKKNIKVLIVSWSPVPTPKYQKIEGSGQRFFGLANGLKKNGIKDITIAVGYIYPLDVNQVSGIKLFNYNFDSEFIQKLSEYDTVIFNYTIHGSSFIANNVPDKTQVIVDAYGPAYLENLARNPENLIETYIGNLEAVDKVFNMVLKRGDFFLYANEAQEKLYTGILCSLGVINQYSYHTKRLLEVPFGIDGPENNKNYKNPYTKYGVKKDDFVLLWFGGIYPWFDIIKILESLKNNKNKKIKFVIVGGNNPQNQHPDFVKHYRNTIDYIEKNNLKDQIILIDWVDYSTRRKYYEHADLIISFNKPSSENIYAWRTRVMDYLGSSTPLITNGGDPLSEELIKVNAAFRAENVADINVILENLINNRKSLDIASKNMNILKPKYYWHNVTKELYEKIINQEKPNRDEKLFRLENNIDAYSTSTSLNANIDHNKYLKIIKIVIQKSREKGVRATSIIIVNKLKRRLLYEYKKRFTDRPYYKPKIVFVSNQLNNTGAPFVLIDLVEQLIKENPKLTKIIKFITFTPIEASNVKDLERKGVNVEVYTNRNLYLNLNKDDIVIFNTFAIPQETVQSAIDYLKNGTIRKLYWYGHEASPEGFLDNNTKAQLVRLLKNNKAKIYAVSIKTKQDYIKFFGTIKNIEQMTFPFKFPDQKFKIRKAQDFEELRFITTGSLMDMRKGQYPILYAFLDFYHNFYVKDPESYRKFHIRFLGAYEVSDTTQHAAYHIRNIKKQFDLSAEGLKDHFSITPNLSHDKAINYINDSNITICYSISEALGIFVYEGMATGHPIIRNESAGQKEQLVNNKNGYAVSSKDFAGLVEVIEKMLNKNKTSNKDLALMSKYSYKIAKEATKKEYVILKELHKLFD
jgi:glycosyltransferase involved in cell wall biosynthesis